MAFPQQDLELPQVSSDRCFNSLWEDLRAAECAPIFYYYFFLPGTQRRFCVPTTAHCRLYLGGAKLVLTSGTLGWCSFITAAGP